MWECCVYVYFSCIAVGCTKCINTEPHHIEYMSTNINAIVDVTLYTFVAIIGRNER